MTNRQLEIRVGLFTLCSLVLAAGLIIQFGRLSTYWTNYYTIGIRFPTAAGVYPSTEISRNGIAIGHVREIRFDDKRGGVLLLINIEEGNRIPEDTNARLVRSVLGDTSIELIAGKSKHHLKPGGLITGFAPSDPMELVGRMEEQMSLTLQSFRQTSQEWQQVGRQMNSVMQTQQGNLEDVIERTANALTQFTVTMKNANQMLEHTNSVIGDPAQQENLKQTLAGLPIMVKETNDVIAVAKQAMMKVDQNLSNMQQVTKPLAKRSEIMVARLDQTLANLQAVSAELNAFSKLINQEDGSLKQLATNPDLYRNLNRSATQLSILLHNVQPIMKDLRIFSDKVARHPEILGVRGAVRGSSGIKDDTEIRQTNGRKSPGLLRQ